MPGLYTISVAKMDDDREVQCPLFGSDIADIESSEDPDPHSRTRHLQHVIVAVSESL